MKETRHERDEDSKFYVKFPLYSLYFFYFIFFFVFSPLSVLFFVFSPPPSVYFSVIYSHERHPFGYPWRAAEGSPPLPCPVASVAAMGLPDTIQVIEECRHACRCK